MTPEQYETNVAKLRELAALETKVWGIGGLMGEAHGDAEWIPAPSVSMFYRPARVDSCTEYLDCETLAWLYDHFVAKADYMPMTPGDRLRRMVADLKWMSEWTDSPSMVGQTKSLLERVKADLDLFQGRQS